MITRDELVGLVLELAANFNADLEYKIAVEKGDAAGLFGEDGVLDSLNLVSFVIAVEQAVSEKCGIKITLADEKAMSQRRSPFRTVGTLTDHIISCIAAVPR